MTKLQLLILELETMANNLGMAGMEKKVNISYVIGKLKELHDNPPTDS
jgi:hypothetical protein